MLSRTADHLYWMARYIERAENMARTLDVTYNMSLVPNEDITEAMFWSPALEISGTTEIYERDIGEVTAANVINYLAMDQRNPSSIYSALKYARENAHAVRVTMTSETWESINSIWLEFSQFHKQDFSKKGLREFCDWVKTRSHLFRGVCFGTMLRDDAFNFVRLGTFIERADNTARLLDVKYHLLLPSGQEVGGAVDYYEWSSVLRSVSAFQAYQKIFNDTIEPWRVAELLILRCDMPRSLHACFDEIILILEALSKSKNNEAFRLAGEIHARLHYGKIKDIFQYGLHEFLSDFIKSNDLIGQEIHKHFLSATY